MAHGYLGDGYGSHGDIGDRDDERERGWRDRTRERDEEWRGRERDRPGGRLDERDRGFLLGDRDEDRWSDRSSETYGREHGYGGFQGDYRGGRDQGGFGGAGDYRQGPRSFSAHPDDHYRSWRDRHMAALDRDYEDYCREREQAFHQDFDAWRRQRHANYQPLRTGMTDSGMSHDPSGELQLTTEASGDSGAADPTDAATLGTNSSDEGRTGRGRR